MLKEFWNILTLIINIFHTNFADKAVIRPDKGST